MAKLKDNLGRTVLLHDFSAADLTPKYPYSADGIEDGYTGSPNEIDPIEVPTPEAEDNYVGMSISLPRGSHMAQGGVTKRVCYNDGNVVGMAYDNPIFGSHKYAVEFEGGEEAELTANTITESTYV